MHIIVPVWKQLTPCRLQDALEHLDLFQNVLVNSDKLYAVDADFFLWKYFFVNLLTLGVCLPISTEYIKNPLCTENVCYFEEKAFVQIDGVEIGNPLGPTSANLFLGTIEQQVHNNNSELPSQEIRW